MRVTYLPYVTLLEADIAHHYHQQTVCELWYCDSWVTKKRDIFTDSFSKSPTRVTPFVPTNRVLVILIAKRSRIRKVAALPEKVTVASGKVVPELLKSP